MNKKSRGFTLIELLVVIAIIGLLSSVVFTSLNTARAKARDARRAADFNQIALALEMYLDDNGDYPPGGYDTCSGNWSNGFNTKLAPYLSSVPMDPLNKTGGNCNTNPHYAFYNPVSWDFEGNCSVGTIILYDGGPGAVETKVFRDDCNTGININNIVFKK